MFKDRYEAALLLVERLRKYKNKKGIVLAIPRGGVPIGFVLARDLCFPLDILLSKKIGHPFNPEFAIGAVSLYGTIIHDDIPGVPQEYVEMESKRLLKELKLKHERYSGQQTMPDVEGQIVIIADDGIATGNTVLATIEELRKAKPGMIVIATPVASQYAIDKLSPLVDEIVCLLIPRDFLGVGEYYDDFSQVTEPQMLNLIEKAGIISR